jgi:hypothetical protein
MTYKDAEAVCYHIQNYIDISRYNLKRTTNEAHPKRLTFVCSCVCKKIIKDEDNMSINESMTDSVKKRSNNLKGFIKRHNSESCPYRLSFLKSENGEYVLRSRVLNEHNHPPEKVILYLILF